MICIQVLKPSILNGRALSQWVGEDGEESVIGLVRWFGGQKFAAKLECLSSIPETRNIHGRRKATLQIVPCPVPNKSKSIDKQSCHFGLLTSYMFNIDIKI